MFQTTNQLLLWLLVVEKTLNESVIIPKKTMIEGATFDRAVESLGCWHGKGVGKILRNQLFPTGSLNPWVPSRKPTGSPWPIGLRSRIPHVWRSRSIQFHKSNMVAPNSLCSTAGEIRIGRKTKSKPTNGNPTSIPVTIINTLKQPFDEHLLFPTC